MPTGQQIVSQALTTIGILEQGGSPNASDSVASLAELNNLWSGWSVDEGLIYAVQNRNLAITGGYASAVASSYPSRIYSANFVTVTGGAITGSGVYNGGSGYAVGDIGYLPLTSGFIANYTVLTISGGGAVATFSLSTPGSGYLPGLDLPAVTLNGSGTGLTVNILSVSAQSQSRTQLKVVNSAQYYSHRDLSATALVPDEVYPEFAPDSTTSGYERYFLWPVPSGVGNPVLELNAGVPFNTWSLTTNYNIPPGYWDAINYALAFRLLMPFGVTDQAIVELVTAEAQKSELRIRKMNATNRQLPPGADMLEQPQAQPAKA